MAVGVVSDRIGIGRVIVDVKDYKHKHASSSTTERGLRHNKRIGIASNEGMAPQRLLSHPTTPIAP
jgi:hypothetical protein